MIYDASSNLNCGETSIIGMQNERTHVHAREEIVIERENKKKYMETFDSRNRRFK